MPSRSRRGRKRCSGDAGDETRVVDEEAHVGKALRDDADVAALAVLVGLLAERQALVHADHLHAERARFLDEAHADVVGEEEALAVRVPTACRSSTRRRPSAP